jgi:hypothetical protein
MNLFSKPKIKSINWVQKDEETDSYILTDCSFRYSNNKDVIERCLTHKRTGVTVFVKDGKHLDERLRIIFDFLLESGKDIIEPYPSFLTLDEIKDLKRNPKTTMTLNK